MLDNFRLAHAEAESRKGISCGVLRNFVRPLKAGLGLQPFFSLSVFLLRFGKWRTPISRHFHRSRVN